MISDILALYQFVDKGLLNASILKGVFSWDGNKKNGSAEIAIRLHGNPQTDKYWFYQVLPYKNFTFVPFPTNPAVHFDFGIANSDKNPNADYFRFVSSPLSKVMSGGEPNVKVDFIVLGYLPEDLIDKVRRQ